MLKLLHLDPEHLAGRLHGAPASAPAPSLTASLIHGSVGFALVALAGFAPWALAGAWLHRNIGELGMYLACACVFVTLGGPVLHRLVIGPGALPRFSILFVFAYLSYAALWICAWMTLHGNFGSIIGLTGGCLVMGWMLCRAFAAPGVLTAVCASLLVGNLLGYYGGGYAEALVAGLSVPAVSHVAQEKPAPAAGAMLAWGACYGLCVGAGLGAALYLCQDAHRALVAQLTGGHVRSGSAHP